MIPRIENSHSRLSHCSELSEQAVFWNIRSRVSLRCSAGISGSRCRTSAWIGHRYCRISGAKRTCYRAVDGKMLMGLADCELIPGLRSAERKFRRGIGARLRSLAGHAEFRSLNSLHQALGLTSRHQAKDNDTTTWFTLDKSPHFVRLSHFRIAECAFSSDKIWWRSNHGKDIKSALVASKVRHQRPGLTNIATYQDEVGLQSVR